VSEGRTRRAPGTYDVSVYPPRFDRPEVEVRASTKRKKTGNAHWSGTRIIVQIPARLRGRERDHFVDELVDRLLAQRPQSAGHDAALAQRASELAELYNDGVGADIVRWVTNQRQRWASCSPSTREIRVSTRLRQCPEWVIDAVLVHELAHLQEIDHSERFWRIANRHPRQEDSANFLEGYSLGLGVAMEESDVITAENPEVEPGSLF
jgi:predicted metal-dependent hydrolase